MLLIRALRIYLRGMSISKHLLIPNRVRRPPASGFSWVDRRFLRDHAALGRDAILLYFFLAAAGDKHGVSRYREIAVASRLRLRETSVAQAYEDLVLRGLVARRPPLVQVLSLSKVPPLEAGGHAEKPEQRLPVPERVRRPPPTGFSWVDRGFIRSHMEALGGDAILLYFFLAAVSDARGLSFWADRTISARLHIEEGLVALARDELIRRDLVAHSPPLTQVLSLPRLQVRRSGSQVEQLGDVLQRLAERRGRTTAARSSTT